MFIMKAEMASPRMLHGRYVEFLAYPQSREKLLRKKPFPRIRTFTFVTGVPGMTKWPVASAFSYAMFFAIFSGYAWL